MSRNFNILDKMHPLSPHAGPDMKPGPQPAVRAGDYTELIQRLFYRPSAVAIFGAGAGNDVAGICEGIAAELSRNGRHVVVVSVDTLLHSSPVALPDEAAFSRGSAHNVWHWPSRPGQQNEFFNFRAPAGPGNWLDSLRGNFDSVLLDCPALEKAPGGVAVGAMAEAAVLAVEAHTPRIQVLRDQRALQLSGVKLAGCILVNAK